VGSYRHALHQPYVEVYLLEKRQKHVNGFDRQVKTSVRV
jgi:hypothetical protein